MVQVSKGPAKFFRLSPDEREALGGFAVRRGDARVRLDVNYSALGPMVEERLARSRYPVVTIGDLEERLQYGCSKRADVDPVGLPILRMSNMQPDGWDLQDLKYVELTSKERDLWLLEQGDILFNRTNSKELVGKCEVFREPGEWVFASYLMRLTVDIEQVSPDFVSAYLSSPGGRAQIERESRQIIGMTNINAEEIRTLRIPLPHSDIQTALLAELDAARAARDSGLAAADLALEGLDAFILDELGLTLPPLRDPTEPFAVRHSALRGGRLDPQSLAPMGLPVNARNLPMVTVASVLNEANRAPGDFGPDDEVPYVGLPECDLQEVREIATRQFAEVGGRSVAKAGDILFARIEPSVFNRKYVFAETLGDAGWAFLSTEFYAVRAKGDQNDQRYLYALLLSDIVQRQVRGKTTGTSGRRRLDRDMFDSMIIPWPDANERAKIASEVDKRRAEARLLRAEARAEWAKARQSFEEALWGPAT
jgi:type I restriction enzyme S subunit